MRLFIILVLIFVYSGAYALDIGGIGNPNLDKVDVDANKAKDGVGLANEVLAFPEAREPGEIGAETTDFLNKWKAGMANDMRSLAGENQGMISNLKGTIFVDGQIGCIGNTEIASVRFINNSSSVGMSVKLKSGGMNSISNIRGVCSGGFTVCDKITNDALCSKSLNRTPDASKQSHSCNAFPGDICRSWQPFVTGEQLLFEPLGDTCDNIGAVTDDIYNTLTGQISGALSKSGLPVGKIDRKGSEAIIYSMQSENCTMGGFGSGLTNMDDLTALYDPKAVVMPDSSQAMKDAATDNDSIYNLIQSGNNIDFGGGTIGMPSFNKCEINNVVILNITGVEKRDEFSGSYKLCTDHYINSRVRRVGSRLVVEFKGGNEGDNLKGCYSWVGADVAKDNDGWFSVYEVAAPISLKASRLTYSVSGEGCNTGLGSSSLSGEDNNQLICSAGGTQYPTITWQLELIYSEDKLGASLSTSNSCEALEKNDECIINKELICDNQKNNCIETIKDGKKSNVAIKMGCYESTSGVHVFNICPMGNSITVSGPLGNITLPTSEGIGWSNIQREYRCTPKSTGLEDTSKGLEDIFGIIGDGTEGVKLPDSCYIKFCSTSKRYHINNIYGSGQTNESIGNSASVERLVKQCSAISVPGGLEFRCPVNGDEIITEDCSCDNKDQLVTNLTDVLLGFAMAEELKKYLNCDNSTGEIKP